MAPNERIKVNCSNFISFLWFFGFLVNSENVLFNNTFVPSFCIIYSFSYEIILG